MRPRSWHVSPQEPYCTTRTTMCRPGRRVAWPVRSRDAPAETPAPRPALRHERLGHEPTPPAARPAARSPDRDDERWMANAAPCRTGTAAQDPRATPRERASIVYLSSAFARDWRGPPGFAEDWAENPPPCLVCPGCPECCALRWRPQSSGTARRVRPTARGRHVAATPLSTGTRHSRMRSGSARPSARSEVASG